MVKSAAVQEFVSCSALAFSFAHSSSCRERKMEEDGVQDYMACLMSFRAMKKAQTASPNSFDLVLV